MVRVTLTSLLDEKTEEERPCRSCNFRDSAMKNIEHPLLTSMLLAIRGVDLSGGRRSQATTGKADGKGSKGSI